MSVVIYKETDIIYTLGVIRKKFNQGGYMKKVFVISLILVSIFLISNAEAGSVTSECKCYQCAVKYSVGQVISWEDTDNVQMCISEDGYAGTTGSNLPWYCDLGGRSLFSSKKDFLGLGYAQWSQGQGCSVQLRGRSMTIDLYDSYGGMTQFRCVQGSECPDMGQ